MPSISLDNPTVAEGTCLGTVAVNRDRLAVERLHDEIRDPPPIPRSHARTIRVEYPDDAGVDAMVSVIGHRHGFGKPLRLVIDTARPDRVHVAPIRLRLRMDERIAIHFAGAGDEEARPLGQRNPERVVRAERPDLQRLDRELEIVHRAGRRRKVEHPVEFAGHLGVIRDVFLHEGEPRFVREVRQVVAVPRDEVVEPDDRVAVRKKAIREMGTEEPCRAGDQDPHERPRPSDR